MDSDVLAQIEATAGRPRNAMTPCAWPGCVRSPDTGHVLVRANAKGRPGIWMCRDDAAQYVRAKEAQR